MLPQDSGPTPLGPDLAGRDDAALVALARAGRRDAFRHHAALQPALVPREVA